MRQNVIRSAWRVAAAAMVVAGAFCGQAHAVNDILSKWTMENVSAPNGNFTASGTFGAEVGFGNTVSGLHLVAPTGTNTTTYSTPVGNGSGKSFSATSWSAGDYWELTASDLGSGFSNYGLQFDQVSSTTGPRDWNLQYSTDGTIFTTLSTYSVQPNATPGWSSAGAVAPAGLDTFDFDLRSITGLNSNPNAKIRLTAASPIAPAQQGSTAALTGTDRIDNVSIFYNYDPTQSPVTQPGPPPASVADRQLPAAVLPVTGDIVFGIGSGRQKTTLELVRGSTVLNGGAKPKPYSPWTAQNFSRFVKFDNLGGTNAHNVHGNLLGVDTGASTTGGGNIYSYATQGSIPSPAPQLLANTGSTSGSAAATTIGGLSVAPNNSKIALTGFNTGKVLVYDYTAGNGLGTGAALSGLRQSAAILGIGANYSVGLQQGTAWKDNNTVLTFSGEGNLYEVDATSMANTLKKTVTVSAHAQKSTSLAYNPNVSPYVYAMYSSFSTTAQTPPSTTTNTLFVFDPASNYNELTGGLDFSGSAFAVRDIALDASGNLFLSTAGSTAAGQGRMEYIPNVLTPGSITANSSVDWYLDEVFGGVQNGLDIGFAPPALAGDYNNDGKVNSQDYVIWRKTNVGGAGGYTTWRANYGNGGTGAGSSLSGASVPEPTSVLLLVIGLAAFCPRRRSA